MGMLRHEWEALQSKSSAATTTTAPSTKVPDSEIAEAAKSSIPPAEGAEIDL